MLRPTAMGGVRRPLPKACADPAAVSRACRAIHDATRRSIGHHATMHRRWLFGLALCCASSSARLLAQADEPSTSSLSWVRLAGAESCVSTQRLAERVEKRLGRRAFVSASQADLSFEGRIQHDTRHDAWVATIVVSDRAGRIVGRRELHAIGSECSSIEDSLVLVLAIAIDPGGVIAAVLGMDDELSNEASQLLSQLDLPRANDADLLQQLTIVRPEPPADNTMSAAASPNGAANVDIPAPGYDAAIQRAPVMTASELRLFFAAGADFGVLPHTAVGGLFGVSYQPRAMATFELFAFGYVPLSTSIASQDRPTAASWRAEFELYGVGVRVCPWSLGPANAQVGLCAGGRLGALSVQGRGFAQEVATTRAWAQAELQARLTVTLGSVALQLAAGPAAALVRDRMQFADAAGERQTFYRPAALSAAVSLAAALRLD